MSSPSCSIIGRTRLGKPSRLHKNLLGFLKRKSANKAFFLSQNPKFQRTYGNFILHLLQDGEPSCQLFTLMLVSAGITLDSSSGTIIGTNDELCSDEGFLKVVAREASDYYGGETPSFEVRRDENGATEIHSTSEMSYDEAVDRAKHFNTLYAADQELCAIVESDTRGTGNELNYKIVILLNTPQARVRLQNALELKSLAERLLEIFEKNKIVITDLQISHQERLDLKDVYQMLGLIQYCNQGYTDENLVEAAGRSLVQMLKNNSLITRLLKIVSEHPEEIADLLEIPLLDFLTYGLDEQTGMLLAQYLREANEIRNNEKKDDLTSQALKLIQRIFNYIRSKLGTIARSKNFSKAKYDAARLAYELANDILDENVQLDPERVAIIKNAQQKVSVRTQTIFDSVNKLLRSLDITVNQYRTKSREGYKTFKKLFDNAFNLYHKATITLELNIKSGIGSESPLAEDDAQLDALYSFGNVLANTVDMISEQMKDLQMVINGVDENTGKEIDMKTAALIVKQNQDLYKLAQNLITSWHNIYQNISHTDNMQVMLQIATINEALKTLEHLMLDANGVNSETGIEQFKRTGYLDIIDDARFLVASRLLKEINGSEFVAMSQYVRMNVKSLRDKSAGNLSKRETVKLYNLNDELKDTSIDPPFQWVSRWIYSLADSPDLVNQMVYDLVNRKKLEADLKTLENKKWIFDWYDRVRKAGIKHTSIFYELGEESTPTGYLLSERMWGKWEQDLEDHKKQWQDDFCQLLIQDGKIHDRSEMYHLNEYLIAYAKMQEEWHETHSKRTELLDTDGNVMLDDEGMPIETWVPISSDDESFTQNYDKDGKLIDYKNEQYQEMIKKNPKAKELLDEYIKFKRENLDSQLPIGSTNPWGLLAPQFTNRTTKMLDNIMRKSYDENGNIRKNNRMQRLGAAFLRRWIKYNFYSNPEDMEFGGQDTAYGEDELYDAKRNLIYDTALSNALSLTERLPMYGVKKLNRFLEKPNAEDSDLLRNKKETRRRRALDDLSLDLASSTMAYAHMANRYGCLDEIIDSLEQVNDQLLDRKINNVSVRERMKMGRTPGSYARLQDYMKQQVYNHYSNNSNTRSYKILRRFCNRAAMFGSYYFLSNNMTSALTNAFTGFNEMLKESFGGEDFNFIDFQWALGMFVFIWGSAFLRKVGNWAVGNNKVSIFNGQKTGSVIEAHNKGSLFLRTFDTQNENERYYRKFRIETKGAGITGGNDLLEMSMLPYTITDKWMQAISYLGAARHIKLINKETGKKVSLWDAYEVQGERVVPIGGYDKWMIEDPKKKLLINAIDKKTRRKDSVERDYDAITPAERRIAFLSYMEDGVEKFTDKLNLPYSDWDIKQENIFKMKCRSVNNRMHGVYNRDDAGAYMNVAFGTLIASLKKYAIGLIDSRFSSIRIDYKTGQMRLGRYMTMVDLFADCITDKYLSQVDPNYHPTLAPIANSLIKVFDFLCGICKASLIMLSGGALFHNYLKRYYSDNQIANFRKIIGDQLVPFLLHCLMTITAPPDEYEKLRNETFFFLPVYKWLPNLSKEIDEEFGFVSDAMVDAYSTYLKNNPFTIVPEEDKDLITPEGIKESVEYVTKGEGRAFGLSGILYYQGYRCMIEQLAYNPASPASVYAEFKGLTNNTLPAVSAVADCLSLIKKLATPIEEMDIVKKGRRKGWYKSGAHVVRVLPARSFEQWIEGHLAKQNMEYWRATDLGLR